MSDERGTREAPAYSYAENELFRWSLGKCQQQPHGFPGDWRCPCCEVADKVIEPLVYDEAGNRLPQRMRRNDATPQAYEKIATEMASLYPRGDETADELRVRLIGALGEVTTLRQEAADRRSRSEARPECLCTTRDGRVDAVDPRCTVHAPGESLRRRPEAPGAELGPFSECARCGHAAKHHDGRRGGDGCLHAPDGPVGEGPDGLCDCARFEPVRRRSKATNEDAVRARAKVHTLKCWPSPFEAMRAGRKTFEYRLNDRGYQVGDCLMVQEYDHLNDRLTGEILSFRVVYLLEGRFGVPDGYCVMGIEPWAGRPDASPDLVGELADLVVWMSGSADFAPEGQAGQAWKEKGLPLLKRALDACRERATK